MSFGGPTYSEQCKAALARRIARLEAMPITADIVRQLRSLRCALNCLA